MEKTSLSAFFSPAPEEEDFQFEEPAVLLCFQYGAKSYTTSIDFVREIVDFSLFIPFPRKTKFSGVFNLRGTIVPIFNPEQLSLLQRERQRLIVFEVEKGELVALPATGILKKEIEQQEFARDPAFVTIEGVPYEYFDIGQKLKDAA